VGQVARLTGVSPDLLRAWERRYGAILPVRTPGGTRRYRPSDIERLRLLKASVDAGHRISEVAGLSSEELERRLAAAAPKPDSGPIAETLLALERLDGAAAEQQISAQLSALGPVRFAKEFALPLVHAIGDAWAQARLCVASEHLGSALLRSLLGSALRPTHTHREAPVVVFGTLPGERHEIGLLVAALTALGAGANPLYLGPDLPIGELVRSAVATKARALAVSTVVGEPDELLDSLETLRAELPDRVELWVGGPRSAGIPEIAGVHVLGTLTRLEQRVELVRIARQRV
jgi:DNA-binding transcriptional MerR regulator